MFTLNEYAVFMLLINWVFLNLNQDLEELPSESIITTYFTRYFKNEYVWLGLKVIKFFNLKSSKRKRAN